jgi:VanZ family protein
VTRTLRLLRWLPFTAGVCLLLWAATQESPAGDVRVWDKALHFGAYAVLGWLAQVAFHPGPDSIPSRVLMAAAATMVCAFLDEWLQISTPGRDASVADGLADLAGLGFSSFVWLRRTRRREVPE